MAKVLQDPDIVLGFEVYDACDNPVRGIKAGLNFIKESTDLHDRHPQSASLCDAQKCEPQAFLVTRSQNKKD